MDIAIIFAAVLVALFSLAYITKRRFGVLGLALAAGSMLSELWAAKLTPIVADAGVIINQPPLITVVEVMLVLLPAVLLLFSGPSYHARWPRIGGAVLFASLALALLVEPLGSALVLQAEGKQVYDFFAQNRVYIVTIALVIAVIDLLGAQTGGSRRKGKH